MALKYGTLTTNIHKQEKRVNINIGKYSGISLINARKKAQSYRDILAQDLDPKEERDNKLTEEKVIYDHTVKNIACWLKQTLGDGL